jgi:hypothetical protein
MVTTGEFVVPDNIQTLEDYSKFIGVQQELTLIALIQSHYRLRESYQLLRQDEIKAFTEARNRGYRIGLEQAAHNSLTFDRIAKLTIAELAKLLEENT